MHKTLLTDLLKQAGLLTVPKDELLIQKLLENPTIIENLNLISTTKDLIMTDFNILRDKEDFIDAHIIFPNASVKKVYEHVIDLSDFPNIKIENIIGLDKMGLSLDPERLVISGLPEVVDAFNIEINFYHEHDKEKIIETKSLHIFVNPDPRSLWKNIPSDASAAFSKQDSETYFGDFLDKKILIASTRGRAHAHDGSFREDDFYVKNLPDEWSIIAVSDGAGTAKLARLGSELSSRWICERFDNLSELENLSQNIENHFINSKNENDIIESKETIINQLYKNVLALYESLNDFATEHQLDVKDLNATLIFVLAKKFSFGYVLLSFGVGDCPITIIETDFSDVHLLNKMDVGEFGGGTRFITSGEIYDQSIANRFGIHKVDNFSKLCLMTDGIYDPKFVTENKLDDLQSWKNFFQDLNGNNESQHKVDFKAGKQSENQLLQWMDFWSVGNHDDRTLAIIF